MKSIIRLTVMLALAVTALFPAVALTANAQGMTCYNLPDADCKLFQAATSSDAAAKLTSFTADYTLNLALAGTGTSDGTLSITGTGQVSVDPSVIASLKGTTNPDPAAMMKALGAITLQNTAKATGNVSGQKQDGNLEFRIVGGKLYYMGDVATQGKWMVLDLAPMLQMMGSSMTGMAPSTTGGSSTNPMSNPKIAADAEALMKVQGIVDAKAEDGPSVDGQATRKLTLNINLGTLLNAPEFKTLMTDAAASSGGQSADAAQFNAMLPLLQTVAKNTTLNASYLIGTGDSLLHGFGLTFATKLDPSIAAMMTSNPDAKELDVNFDLNFQLSKIGQPVKVDPVADAQPADMGGSK